MQMSLEQAKEILKNVKDKKLTNEKDIKDVKEALKLVGNNWTIFRG